MPSVKVLTPVLGIEQAVLQGSPSSNLSSVHLFYKTIFYIVLASNLDKAQTYSKLLPHFYLFKSHAAKLTHFFHSTDCSNLAD